MKPNRSISKKVTTGMADLVWLPTTFGPGWEQTIPGNLNHAASQQDLFLGAFLAASMAEFAPRDASVRQRELSVPAQVSI